MLHSLRTRKRSGACLDNSSKKIRNSCEVKARNFQRENTNIKRSYGLYEIKRHPNDQQSVLSWIEEWSHSEYNPILFHKLQGEEDTEEGLSTEDFMIIVQSDVQRAIAEKFSANGLCCDSTHGTTVYDFYLTTLLCVNEFGEGFPIAWYLSNHEDRSFMRKFFEKVKASCCPISPAWFMSDLATQYYNTFSAVNQCQPKRLFCTWYVDKAWKDERSVI